MSAPTDTEVRRRAQVVCDLALGWYYRAVEAGEVVANLELSQATDALRAALAAPGKG